MGIKNVMLIINPCAGRKSGKKNADKVISMLKKHGLECTLFMTQRRGDATQFVIDDGNKYDIVVCMGGDGTLNEVINGVLKAHLSIPLGYIPAGSTNDFARSMHLSKNLEKSARIIAECNVQDIDAGLFNDRYFGYVSSFGLFTRTSYSTPQRVKNILGGKISYLLHAVTELGKVKAEQMRVETNGKVYEGKFLFGAITNITDNPYIEFDRSDRFTVYPTSKSDWSLDGEFAYASGSSEIRCLKNKIKFICPAQKK